MVGSATKHRVVRHCAKNLTLHSDTVSISGDMLIVGVFTSNAIYLKELFSANKLTIQTKVV